jgi:uncharacterized protein YcfJ
MMTLGIRFKQFACLAPAALFAPHALAQGYEYSPEQESVTFAYADVLSSDPIVERIQEARPREVCQDVEVSRGSNGAVGTVIGAVVGAVVGNQVGSGDGRRAATAAGAVVGGAVGREIDSSNDANAETRLQRQCEVVDEYVERQQIVGYDVQYRFRGEVFSSRISYDPGEKLRIRLAISPAAQ